MLHRTERTLENIPVGPLGFIPVDESDYDDLKSLFDDFKYECFNNESSAAFVDYGYVPFQVVPSI